MSPQKMLGSFCHSIRKNTHRASAGQTIIEVLIATTAVSMVMITIMSSLVLSIVNTNQGKYQSQAASRAQEAVEVLRRERDRLGWSIFYDLLAETTYCFNTLPASSEAFITATSENVGQCDAQVTSEDLTFSREISVAKPSGTPNQVLLTIVIEWLKPTGQTEELVITSSLRDF